MLAGSPARVIAAVCLIAGCQPVTRVGAACATRARYAPFDERAAIAPRTVDAPTGVLDAIVASYQHHARPDALPGTGCPFAPTCSVYARAALAQHGVLGVLLIVDRVIVREHAMAPAYYPAMCVAHTTRLDDEVP